MHYVLVRHLAKPCEVLGLASKADDALISTPNKIWDSSNERIKDAVVGLESCLKSIECLALPIKLVVPLGEIVRRTSPFPPTSHERRAKSDSRDAISSSDKGMGSCDLETIVDAQLQNVYLYA